MPRRISILLIPALAAACTHNIPVGLYDTSWPLGEGFHVIEPVSLEKCSNSLFGILPLDQGITMYDLITEAKGRHDAVVQITVDSSYTNAIFVSTYCLTLHGYQVDINEASAPPNKAKAQDVPAATDKSGRFSSAAYRSADMVYAAIKKTPPSDPAQQEKDVEFVWKLVNKGIDISRVVRAAEIGAKQKGVDASLEELIRIGWEKSDKTNVFEFDEDAE